MRYLLDTNAVIALLNDARSAVALAARQHPPGDLHLSAIVTHELFYGAFKSQRRDRNVELIDRIQLEIVEFDREDARKAGEIRAILALAGTLIGPYDILIAGQALARDMILITHNTDEFARVPGLRLEDWTRQASP